MPHYIITAEHIYENSAKIVYYTIDREGAPQWSYNIGDAHFFDERPNFFEEVGPNLDNLVKNITKINIRIVDTIPVETIKGDSINDFKIKKEIDKINSQINMLQKRLGQLKSS